MAYWQGLVIFLKKKRNSMLFSFGKALENLDYCAYAS
jgi:hypothetical protein